MLSPLYPDVNAREPTFAGVPDGMAPLEAAVWQLFRVANLHRMRAVYFNVHVGTVPGDVATDLPATRRVRAALYSKRVDVIADAPPETWIIEVKVRANPSALGQLHVYVPLVAARFPDWPNARPLVIAQQCDADAAAIAGTLGIECLTPPFAPLVPR